MIEFEDAIFIAVYKAATGALGEPTHAQLGEPRPHPVPANERPGIHWHLAGRYGSYRVAFSGALAGQRYRYFPGTDEGLTDARTFQQELPQ